MFTNRISKIFVVLFVLVAALATISFATRSANVSAANHLYVESSEQAFREYQLGERYGELPQTVALFSAEQIQRDYVLDERYGATPQDYALRHPELSKSPEAVDTSDYFLRHPELIPSNYMMVDTSDYFLRHPEFKIP